MLPPRVLHHIFITYHPMTVFIKCQDRSVNVNIYVCAISDNSNFSTPFCISTVTKIYQIHIFWPRIIREFSDFVSCHDSVLTNNFLLEIGVTYFTASI